MSGVPGQVSNKTVVPMSRYAIIVVWSTCQGGQVFAHGILVVQVFFKQLMENIYKLHTDREIEDKAKYEGLEVPVHREEKQ